MYAYKEYLINGHCPFCDRDLSLHISSLDGKFKHVCVDCQRSLTIVPNLAMFAEILDDQNGRAIADVMPVGKDCCGV